LDLWVCRYLQWSFKAGEIFCGINQPGGRAYCHPDKFPPISSYLFRNNGDGTFAEVSERSGIAVPTKGLGVAFADFNQDGWVDVSVANDSFPQLLFKNNGNGTFSEVGEMAGVGYTEEGKTFAGMGTDFADVDNDGYPDIVTTALPYEYFSYFHNNHDGSFSYATLTSNLGRISRVFSGWGMRIFDYDNDGNKDLFVANSHVMDNIALTQPHLSYRQKPLLLRNAGNEFSDVSSASGSIFGQSWASRGAAFGDLDNDGDIDIVVSTCDGPAYVLMNEGRSQNHWLSLELVGTKSNRMGLGARVTLTTREGRARYSEASTAGSYLSANDARVFFGLGTETSIREVRILWPSGLEQHLESPKPDRILTVTESGLPKSPETKVSRGNGHPASLSAAAKNSATTPISSTPTNDASVKPGKKINARAAVKYREAESLLQKGKIEEAVGTLREAIQIEPQFAEAHFALGVILARQGREHDTDAINHFLEVVKLEPRHVDARINLSNLLEEEDDPEGAAGALQEALALAGERADLYVMLGKKQQRAEKYNEALHSFHRALELDPRIAGAHYGLGMTLRSMGDIPAAQVEFEQALKLDPNDALAHYQLGRFLILQKQNEGAAHHLEESVRLMPDLADAYAKLGVLYRSQGKNEAAEKAFREAVRLSPKMEKAYYGLALLLQSQGRTDEAQKLFEQVKQLKTSAGTVEEAASLNASGVALMNAGSLDEAMQKFRASLAMDAFQAAAAYNLGLVLARQNRTEEAIESFRTAIRLRPGFVLAHYGLGLVLRMAGDPSADEQLRKAELMKRVVPQSGPARKPIRKDDAE
jgi:tetratricopeptide (TPR) repeat protein